MASASATTSETTSMEVHTTEQPATTTDAATTAGARASGKAAGDNRGPVELKKWHGVALWRYKIQVEDCAICKAHVTEPCTNCQADIGTVDNTNCPIAWGRCNHAFHLHCIERWLRTRNNCPLDQEEWEYQEHPTTSG